MPTGYDLSDFIPPLTADRNTNSTLAFTSLFAPPGRRAILSRTLSSRIASAEPDVEEIIRRSAQAIPLERLPMLVRLSLNRGTQILIDLGAGMAPFAVDRARIVGEIRDLAGNVERLRFRNSPLDGVMADGSAKFRPWQVPAPRIPILIVSDLGMNRWSPDAKPDAAARWIEFARLAAENGCPVLALVPVDRVDWLPALARHIHMILWDRETSARSVFAATSLHRPSLRPRDLLPLKRTLSLAVRVEPELLRAVRVKLFPALGVGAEAMLWEDADVETRNATGIVFRPDRRQNFQSALAADPELLETAWEIIEPLHRSISPAIRMEEELAYASLSSAPGSQQRAAEITRRIVATLEDADHNAVQSEKMVEIHFQNGKAVAMGDQFGLGGVR